jgi:hypothetical protein
MRDFKGMKRQRNRGRGGGGGGGKPQQHNANRAFDSNGPDNVKVRGAAQHIYEKYQQLARDASAAGDRVLGENYLQHAEHYFRVLRAMQPQRPISEIIGRDQFASGYDIDFEDEGQNAEEPAEAEADGGQDRQGGERAWQRDERPRDDRGQGEYRQRDDRPRDDRPRDDRPRDDRPRDDRLRDDRPRDDRPRDDRDFRGRDDRGPRDDRPQGEYRQRDDRGGQGDYRPREDRGQGEFRPRDERPRDDRGQGERRDRYPRDDRQGRFQAERQGRDVRNERGERPDRDPLGVIEPQATPLTPAAPASYEPPREGGRVLRGEDGATSQAPAFLQAGAPRAEGDEAPTAETKRPRRRRAPRTFDAGDTPAAEADES